jgi:hypothetical protein
MSTVGLGNRNHCTGEGQKQFHRQSGRQVYLRAPLPERKTKFCGLSYVLRPTSYKLHKLRRLFWLREVRRTETRNEKTPTCLNRLTRNEEKILNIFEYHMASCFNFRTHTTRTRLHKSKSTSWPSAVVTRPHSKVGFCQPWPPLLFGSSVTLLNYVLPY